MAYVAREIKDRVAIGDNCFYMEQLEDGRIMLIPAPDSVTEVGTDINKALLQPIEDNVAWLMNRVFNDIASNPFNIQFENLDGLTVTGVWNENLKRIECQRMVNASKGNCYHLIRNMDKLYNELFKKEVISENGSTSIESASRCES